MIKGALTVILIFIICSLENIGHYFGFCFHGMLSTMFGCLGAFGITIGVYLKDIQLWLSTRKYGKRRPHMCKDHHHDIPKENIHVDEM